MRSSRNIFFGMFFAFVCGLQAQEGVFQEEDGFNADRLRQQHTSLLSPERFSMYQSYSVSFVHAFGNSYSQGTYLNTVVYRFDFPLTISFDFGFYTPFYQNFDKRSPWWYDEDAKYSAANFILPRIGIEFQPTPNMHISLQIFNMPDAIRAYSPFWRSYSCREYTWSPDYCTPWHLRHYRYRR